MGFPEAASVSAHMGYRLEFVVRPLGYLDQSTEHQEEWFNGAYYLCARVSLAQLTL